MKQWHAEDHLIRERISFDAIPGPNEPAETVTLRPDPAFAALVDPISYGRPCISVPSMGRGDAFDVTEWCDLMTAPMQPQRATVAPGLTSRRRAIVPLVLSYVAVAAVWACIGAAVAWRMLA